jgi:uncharacterized membrane protein
MLASLPEGRTRLKGAHITTDMVTVTGTENFMMAAALAEGETVLENAAQEPEIPDLAEMLIQMGAKIEGHGTRRIRIQGVDRLHGCEHQVVADRIEAGTFLCAVAAAGGDVVLRHGRADHLEVVIEKLREAGAKVTASLGAEKVISWVCVMALPFTLPGAWLTWPEHAMAPTSWLALVYVGVFSMWAGFFAWFRGLSLGGPLRVSQLQLLQPFISILAAVPLLGESLDAMTLGFALLVVLTVFMGRRMANTPVTR